ncbi:ArsR/SmtB family transcription factor [Sanguibacter suaedae]
MSAMTGEDTLSRAFRALSDPTRLRLLALVAAHEGGEACVVDLTAPLALSQPTISHHLKILVGAGLLTRDRRGVWSYYALVPGALGTLGRYLTDADTAWTGRHDAHESSDG